MGLAIAAKLSEAYQNIFVIEKNASFGQEISSRNSEVIHAGIYYPQDSLKTKTCTEGRRLLYEFCAQNKVLFKNTGKLIVAINNQEVEDLEALFKQGLENGVEGLQFLSKDEVKKIEPRVEAEAGILSSSTGILDSHSLMKSLATRFESGGGTIAYNTEVVGIDKLDGGFEVTVEDKAEGFFKFFTRILVNSAGLNSDKVAKMVGLCDDEYRLKYCKGNYFRISSNKAKFINRLVYPVPKKNRVGLGIHATLDLAGGLRLGPDDEYVEKIDYTVEVSKKEFFYESVRKFLPFIYLEDLSPDTAGIRPKLQGPGEDFKDFVIKEESANGFPGFINLIGIESPGLTSSFSIARMVKDMIRPLL